VTELPPLTTVRPQPSPAAIDPRIRARRIAVQRDTGRRRLRRVVDLGLVLAVVAGFALALRSPLLDVSDVQVGGASRTGVDAVARAAGIELGDQLMDVQLGTAGERIAALPWVQQVELHRGLDGIVRIEVVERTAAAVVGEGDEAVLVDATGRVLARAEDAPDLRAALITVVGVTEGLEPGRTLPPEARQALEVAGHLAAAVPGAVAQVSAEDELVATLVDGGVVRFGDAGRLTAKIRSLATVLTQVDLTCLAQLDVRVPGSPVLTREEPCS
jgi:cell division protein FtsQ